MVDDIDEARNDRRAVVGLLLLAAAALVVAQFAEAIVDRLAPVGVVLVGLVDRAVS